MSVTITQRRPSQSQAEVPAVKKPVVDMDGQEFVAPELTIKDILDAIPAHCYEISNVRGFGYLARDLAFIATIGYLAYTYIHQMPWLGARVLAWIVYAFVQGLFGTGVWVLAHECGHRAFNTSRTVNDWVGWVLHSVLLVPYHSWRLSHSKHHKSTAHHTRDMVFVPWTRERYMSYRGVPEYVEDAPLATLVQLVLRQLVGWPLYLLTNVSGQTYPGKSTFSHNHFSPWSPLFEQSEFSNIVWSDIGLGIVGYGLYLAIARFGLATVALMYFGPYLMVNNMLVHITYLQHAHPKLAFYEADAWTFTRGACSTVDRNFGFIGRHILHSIIETHVAHHFVSRMPFYKARVATPLVAKVLGKHYLRDDTNIYVSLYQTLRSCQFVDGEAIKTFRNVNKIGK